MHKFIPSSSFKGLVTKPRSSSSSRVVIPCLSYQPGRAYHSTHEDRRDFAAARSVWGIEGRWGTQQHGARHAILSDLFPDPGESTYEDWDFKQADVLMAFLNQRMLAAPDETRHIWKLDGPLETNPNDETPSMAWLHMTPSDLGPPRSPALCRDPPPPEPRGVRGPPQWMLVRNAFVTDAFVW